MQHEQTLRQIARQLHSTPRRIDAAAERYVRTASAPSMFMTLFLGLLVAIVGFVLMCIVAFFTRWWIAGLACPLFFIGPAAIHILQLLDQSGIRKKVTQRLERGQLVFANVVQAHNGLYDGHGLAGALVVYSTHPGRALDRDFVVWCAELVRNLKGRASPPSLDLSNAWQMVNNDRSNGTFQLPESIVGNSETFLSAITLSAPHLVGGSLRTLDGTVPCLINEGHLGQAPRFLLNAALGLPAHAEDS